MDQEPITRKEKNMLKAARLRYVDDMSNPEVAEHLGLDVSTIENYFSSDEMKQFERYFSEEEKKYFKVKMKEKIEQNTALANNLISQAVNDPEARPRDKLKASQEVQKMIDRHMEMMHKLGWFDDGNEIEEADTEDLRSELADYYEEKQSVNTEKEEEVEAE